MLAYKERLRKLHKCNKVQRPMQEMNKPQTQTVITIMFLRQNTVNLAIMTQGFQTGVH